MVNPVPMAPMRGDGTGLTIAVDLGGAAEARAVAPLRPVQADISGDRRRILNSSTRFARHAYPPKGRVAAGRRLHRHADDAAHDKGTPGRSSKSLCRSGAAAISCRQADGMRPRRSGLSAHLEASKP
jgi:hypothetical protein